MKKLILIASALMVVNVAQASEVNCGKLLSVNSAPKCEPGQMCPHFIRVIEILQKTSGEQLELQTKSGKVLKKLAALNGSTVCVSGKSINDGQFEVTSVRAAKSAF